MDSLTQIVLGAAVGQAVLGRKLGNRAMIWGAIGGTIPDMDIVANFFMNDLDALVFHRGITHSLSFAMLVPFATGWLVHRLYTSGAYRGATWKWIVTAIDVLLLGLLAGALCYSVEAWWLRSGVIALSAYLVWRLIRYYLMGKQSIEPTTFRDWYWLFFWCFLTHIGLDMFTAYGTQIFQPFSNFRVAFNTISVVDPGYTVPFIILVIIAACLRRQDRTRSYVNWLAIGLSSLYLLMTVYNKQRVDGVFARALESRSIDVDRWRASPTIFNNILWNVTAEAEDAFYLGLYSMYDSNPNIHVVNRIPKHPEVVAKLSAYDDYHTLMWFADGYLQATDADSAIILSDLRFGAVQDSVDLSRDIVFRFFARPGEGTLNIREERRRPENFREEFRALMDRVMGY